MYGKAYIVASDNDSASIKCVKCKEVYTVEVNRVQLALWQKGALIQTVMSGLSGSSRELLISGFCPDCFRKIFEAK